MADMNAHYQAHLAGDVYLVEVPKHAGPDHYPAIPQNNPSSVQIFDPVFMENESAVVMTKRGKVQGGAFASFGGRRKPTKGNADAWCEGFTFMGFSKNKAEKNDAVSHGGVSMLGGRQTALTKGGGLSIRYMGPPVRAFTALVWGPPEVKPNNTYDDSERPVASLHPLHWSILEGPQRHIYQAMLQLEHRSMLTITNNADPYGSNGNANSNNNNDNRKKKKTSMKDFDSVSKVSWREAALEKKRCILTTFAGALCVAVKRGYVTINTPSASNKAAAQDKLIAGLRAGTAAATLLAAYDAAISPSVIIAGYGEELGDQTHYYWNPKGNKIDSIGREDMSSFVEASTFFTGSDTTERSMFKDKEQEHSLEWMVGILGLSGERTLSSLQDDDGDDGVAQYLVRDILHHLSLGALNDPKEAFIYTQFKGAQMQGRQNDALLSLRQHIREIITSEEMVHNQLRDSIKRRVVATTLESTAGIQAKDTKGRGDIVPVIVNIGTGGSCL